MINDRHYQEELSRLRQECYGLINEISQHRYGMKLLLVAKAMLERTLEYKANREKF